MSRFVRKLGTNQSGMASILITMVTMVVVSLIVLGFATISRREQNQTLDQQLSTQAFYAAETAVNDAKQVIEANSGNAPPKTDCTGDVAGYAVNYQLGPVVIDAAHNVSYSCLLVNPSPATLTYDGVGDNSVVVPLNATTTINKIVVTWSPPTPQAGSPAADCPGSTITTFSPTTSWNCNYGVLRMDLLPTAGALTSAGLSASQMSAFFEPQSSSGSGTLSYAAGVGKPNIVAANCNTSTYTQCTATITGLSSTSYTMRLTSLYQTSNVTVSPFNGVTPVTVSGAQATVDATGNANGVLRRIVVQLPLSGYNGTAPDYAIQSNGSVCKRFLVTPTYYANAGDVTNPDTSNAMCDNTLPASGTP